MDFSYRAYGNVRIIRSVTVSSFYSGFFNLDVGVFSMSHQCDVDLKEKC